MFKVLKVTGDSLWPQYKEGDFVIISKIPFFLNRIKIGDTIVFKHADHGVLIKQVEVISAEGDKLHVLGTQENSIDSRQFGEIDKTSVIGKVVLHVRNPKFNRGR